MTKKKKNKIREKNNMAKLVQEFTNELEERVIWLGWRFDTTKRVVFVEPPVEALIRYGLPWLFLEVSADRIENRLRFCFHLDIASERKLLRRLLGASEVDLYEKKMDDYVYSRGDFEPVTEN